MVISENGAGKYAGELDKMIVQESKTGFLSDNVFKAKFSGAQTVHLPEISMWGLGDYDRVNGYAKSDVNLTYTQYKLGQERSRQLFIDAQDADESGVSDLAGKLVGEYTRVHVVPEIDAYVIQKLYESASQKEENVKNLEDSASAVTALMEVINAAEEAIDYDGTTPLVALVNPTMYKALMMSDELQRFISVSEFRQGKISLKVKSLNDCAIIPVASSRMKSEFVFDKGATSTAGGFKASDSAKEVMAIVLPKDSASLVKKVDKVDMHNPGEDVNRDGYTINYRLYYDLFVKNSRKGTIFALV